MTQFLQQHVEILRRQTGEAYDRTGKIYQPGLGEVVFRQTRLQSRIAVEAAASIHEKLGGTTQHKTKPLSGTLQGVIEDTQNLLVVSVASLGVGELVQGHQLIETYHQSAKAGQPNESREQLELIVHRRIVDDGSHTLDGAGICRWSELATQPADSIRLEPLAALFDAFAISRDYISKVIAVDHPWQSLEMLTNDSITVVAGRFGVRLGLRNGLLDYS